MIVKIQNQDVHIDEVYWSTLSALSWRVSLFYKKKYVVGRQLGDRNRTNFYMHVEVAKLAGVWEEGKDIDHIDGDPMNNCLGNLRSATRSQNAANRGPNANSLSGMKGVHKKKNSWVAQIGFHSKTVCIGSFRSAEDAARAYDKKARELFGEFAYQNFPEDAA